MYADLLKCLPQLDAAARRRLKRRLAVARFGLGRAALLQGHWWEGACNLARGVAGDPRRIGRLLSKQATKPIGPDDAPRRH
jgi:hypothetical protein